MWIVDGAAVSFQALEHADARAGFKIFGIFGVSLGAAGRSGGNSGVWRAFAGFAEASGWMMAGGGAAAAIA